MKVVFKYHLKVKKIMGKESDTFEVKEGSTIKEILKENNLLEKLQEIDEQELLIICGTENYDSLDIVVKEESVYCFCTKLYGG